MVSKLLVVVLISQCFFQLDVFIFCCHENPPPAPINTSVDNSFNLILSFSLEISFNFYSWQPTFTDHIVTVVQIWQQDSCKLPNSCTSEMAGCHTSAHDVAVMSG